jgi:hypothetical protein
MAARLFDPPATKALKSTTVKNENDILDFHG